MVYLKDFLAGLPDDADIAIGAASGYFFIGKKTRFMLIEGRISTRLLHNLVDSKHRAQADIQYICDNGVSPMKKGYKKGKVIVPDETLKEYVERINGTAKRLINSWKRLQKYSDAIPAFKNLMSRQVIRTANTEFNGLAIIVEGVEGGKFWTKKEYAEWERTGKYPNEPKGDIYDTATETDS